ncbi:hypothetical protein ARZXY2_2676 [Arthrobacter sp. ZXY-2]|nr:hypothetical protein ARZXY2_2676 [Arthrobacter sp. ZXY-2]
MTVGWSANKIGSRSPGRASPVPVKQLRRHPHPSLSSPVHLRTMHTTAGARHFIGPRVPSTVRL